VKKLLVGGYLNKCYHVFVDNYFMSVPLVCQLHQVSTYITGNVRRNKKLLPQQFKNEFAVGQKVYCRSGPLLTFSARRNHKKKEQPVIFLSRTPQLKKRKYRKDMVAIHKYNQKLSHPTSFWAALTLQT
jgi:hypothetical protein